MRRAEIDGVTVFHQDQPGAMTASLTFGCGTRDEEVDSIGLNHLVHHLLERADPYIAEKYDDDTWVNETSFVAAGTPEQVAEHFTALCSAIGDLPPTDLPDAVTDVDADDRYVSDIDEGVLDPWGSLLARRFGPRGHGLARWPAVDYRLFTVDEIRQHVGRFFTSGNAVLATTAEAPPSMRLRLPAGPRADHDTRLVNHQSGPVWYADEVHGVALVVGSAPSVEALLLMSALRSRVFQAVQRAGIAQFAELMTEVVDGTRHELGIRISPTRARRFDAASAAELLWAELRKLVHDGLDQADMATLEATRTAVIPGELAPTYEALAWRQPIQKFESAVHLELFGTTEHYLTDPLTEPDRLSPAAVRDIVSGWLSSAMIVVPHGSRPELPGVTDASCPSTRFVPAGDVVRPAIRKRFGNKGSLVIGTDAISTVDGEGNVHTVPLSQALVVERDDALWLAHLGHGCVTTISDFAHAAGKLRSVLPARRIRRASRI